MKRILFVCTGNTCRSPMAEYLLKDALKRRGVKNIRVNSAGLAAEPGAPMADNARQALAECGIRAGRFQSRQLTEAALQKANLILTMTAEHRRALEGFANVFTLAEFTGSGRDVPDPYGGSLQVYRETRDALAEACEKIILTIL